jgi:hypothetical protein
MKTNELNQYIITAAIVVIAIVQSANFVVKAFDFQSQIDNAYAIGYQDGDADGFTEGIHAVQIDDHALNCHCDSCVESGRYAYLNENGDNPFKSN